MTRISVLGLMPIILIVWIFDNVCGAISFTYKIIKNLFEKRCNKNIDEIVAIKYYSERWPSLVCFTIHKDGKIEEVKDKYYDPDYNTTEKEFKQIVKCIGDNKLLHQKTYILNNPFVSPIFVYRCFTWTDFGPTTQHLSLIFEDGTKKDIIGYSKRMDTVVDAMENILPEELFF